MFAAIRLGLILRQQLRSRPALRIIRIIHVGNLLTVSVTNDVVVRLDFGGPRRWEVASGGPVLSYRKARERASLLCPIRWRKEPCDSQ